MEIRLDTPLDMHIHLRDGGMLKLVAPLSAGAFAGGVVMPNLLPPVQSISALQAYTQRVTEALEGAPLFSPLMTLFFRTYSEQELLAVKKLPYFFGIKLYPAGVTTNSTGGVTRREDLRQTLRCMEELGIPLSVHGETHGFIADREANFLPVYRQLAETYPKLKICMEHISTAAAVRLLDDYENLCATITLHHLLLTLDDVLGDTMHPHLFCKPIVKREEDRLALLGAALAAHPRVMFGSDTAPHPVHAKECSGCAAGIFSAPVALPCLADLFVKHGAEQHLQAFVSGNARSFYGLQLPRREVVLCDTPMQVPPAYCGYGQRVIPFRAGEQLPRSIAASAATP